MALLPGEVGAVRPRIDFTPDPLVIGELVNRDESAPVAFSSGEPVAYATGSPTIRVKECDAVAVSINRSSRGY
jgi:hypothetical protein